MSKKTIKIMNIILSIFLIICSLMTVVKAGYSDPITSPGGWNPTTEGVDSEVETKISSVAGKILGIVRNIGVSISVIALMIIGVKYMMGSIEQKAKYKQAMVPYLVGIILLAAGTTLVKAIYDIAIKI